MCGITGGLWDDPGKALDASTLQRMIDVLWHRGPDDQGQHLVPGPSGDGPRPMPGIALGHRRLAIVDVCGSRQPLTNEDQTVWLVVNGEVYNYRRLRGELQSGGHRFRTQGDSEVLLHLYEEEGLGFLSRVHGMFALALWDGPRRRLVLARDRLGEKPLIYRHEPGRLLFASELKSLLQVPGLAREIDPQALDEYLTYQYVPHPHCILRGFTKLPPGHLGVYEEGRLDVHAYWQPDFRCEEDRPEGDYIEELRATLSESVSMRLESEVPLGAFLSGGIDSTIIVGLMQRIHGGAVRTCSVGFSVAEYDETHYARLAAERFGTEHEEFRVEPAALEVLPRLTYQFDEPLGDSSAVPTWYVSQLARQRVTVALTGDGGDELFAGYERYLAVALAAAIDRLPRAIRAGLGAGLQCLPASSRQKSLARRLKRFAEALGQSPAERYLQWIAIFNRARRAELYSADFVRQLAGSDPLEFLQQAWDRAGARDPVTAASLADLVTYLPGDLMTKVDMASMAHGLETRPPFLDHRVVELAARMPRRYKLHGGRGKSILRKAFADLLPEAIHRRGKMGFGVPLAQWFRNDLRPLGEEVLLSDRALGRGYFRPEAVRRLWAEHQAGTFDHGYRLWALLMLELWWREWGGG